MRYYETLYIINPNLGDENYGGVVTKFNDLVENKKGTVTNVDEWGKKTLAYEVKKFDKGYYVLLQYCGDPGIVAELERDMKLDDRVLNYQTVKLSNDADPEALKAKAEEPKVEAVEEAKITEEAIPEKEGESEGSQEDKNGI
jgi:small subunit ribosomal protein S6